MSQAADSIIKLPPELESLYLPIRTQLQATEALLRDTLSSRHSFINQLVGHGFRLGGKRLRPALLLMFGEACGNSTQAHISLAASVELIHTATLIHDDILDDATTRRHLETINARWSNEASVLTGDFLLAQALFMASQADDPFAIRDISLTCRTTCEGELMQVADRGNFDLTEAEYYKIIRGKTAALIGCCCRLGAYYAGAEPNNVDAAGKFGVELGVAFQITDDLLDLLGDEAKTGKSLGSDLSKQKLTLPLIHCLTTSEDGRRRMVLDLLNQPESAEQRIRMTEILKSSDALDFSHAAAVAHIDRAVKILNNAFPPSPARDALEGIARYVTRRKL